MTQPICHKCLSGSMVACLSAFSLVNGVHAELIDDFDDRDDLGWTHYDYLGEYGPGIFDARYGEYRLASTEVIPHDVWTLLFSVWDNSIDPSYSEGFLRVRIRAETQNTAVWLVMRAEDPTAYQGYKFFADTADGRFSTSCSPGCSGTYYVDGVDSFLPDEEWFIQGGVVDDRVSIKVWPVGDPEPTVPQLTFQNTTYTTGEFLVGASHRTGFASTMSGVFDDISFTPPGDFDGDGEVGPEDCAGFVGCITGPGPAEPPAECTPGQFDLADTDDDNDVDMNDFSDFQSLAPQ